MKILVSGYLIRKPVAGLAWHYGQYLVGLKKLGHDVLYIEDSEDLTGSVEASLRYAQQVFDYLGFPRQWSLYDFQACAWQGPGSRAAQQALVDADALISVSAPLAVMDWFGNIPVRIFVDTDPVFTQSKTMYLPAWSSRCASYTTLASFGENINRPDCGIPSDGYAWSTTRQPIVLELWETHQKPRPVFSTIMSWSSYASVVSQGTRFGVKADTFTAFKCLPKRTSASLEIALDAEQEVQSDLAGFGWNIASAREISATAERYKAYIQGSQGEFTVAKEAYVASRSGWFSERSACYLASGRPVITQDTGFTTWLDAGLGVLGFRSEDEAFAAIESVLADYEKHADAARQLSRQFDSSAILRRLLDAAHTAPVTQASPGSPAALGRDEYRSIVQQIESTIPDDATFVLVDERRLGLFGFIDKRRVLPFLERNGQYWGVPETSNHAIDELRRLTALGATHLVIVEGSRWWLDYYAGFREFVMTGGNVVLQTDELMIIRLSPVESSKDKGFENPPRSLEAKE